MNDKNFLRKLRQLLFWYTHENVADLDFENVDKKLVWSDIKIFQNLPLLFTILIHPNSRHRYFL